MVQETLKSVKSEPTSSFEDLRLMVVRMREHLIWVLLFFAAMISVDVVVSFDGERHGLNLPFTGIFFALLTVAFLLVSGMRRIDSRPIFGLGLILSAGLLMLEISYVLFETVWPGFLIYFGILP